MDSQLQLSWVEREYTPILLRHLQSLRQRPVPDTGISESYEVFVANTRAYNPTLHRTFDGPLQLFLTRIEAFLNSATVRSKSDMPFFEERCFACKGFATALMDSFSRYGGDKNYNYAFGNESIPITGLQAGFKTFSSENGSYDRLTVYAVMFFLNSMLLAFEDLKDISTTGRTIPYIPYSRYADDSKALTKLDRRSYAAYARMAHYFRETKHDGVSKVTGAYFTTCAEVQKDLDAMASREEEGQDEAVPGFQNSQDLSRMLRMKEGGHPMSVVLARYAIAVQEAVNLGKSSFLRIGEAKRIMKIVERGTVRNYLVAMFGPHMMMLKGTLSAPAAPSLAEAFICGCHPVCINGILDESILAFDRFVVEEVFRLVGAELKGQAHWPEAHGRIDAEFLKLLGSRSPEYPTLSYRPPPELSRSTVPPRTSTEVSMWRPPPFGTTAPLRPSTFAWGAPTSSQTTGTIDPQLLSLSRLDHPSLITMDTEHPSPVAENQELPSFAGAGVSLGDTVESTLAGRRGDDEMDVDSHSHPVFGSERKDAVELIAKDSSFDSSSVCGGENGRKPDASRVVTFSDAIKRVELKPLTLAGTQVPDSDQPRNNSSHDTEDVVMETADAIPTLGADQGRSPSTHGSNGSKDGAKSQPVDSKLSKHVPDSESHEDNKLSRDINMQNASDEDNNGNMSSSTDLSDPPPRETSPPHPSTSASKEKIVVKSSHIPTQPTKPVVRPAASVKSSLRPVKQKRKRNHSTSPKKKRVRIVTSNHSDASDEHESEDEVIINGEQSDIGLHKGQTIINRVDAITKDLAKVLLEKRNAKEEPEASYTLAEVQPHKRLPKKDLTFSKFNAPAVDTKSGVIVVKEFRISNRLTSVSAATEVNEACKLYAERGDLREPTIFSEPQFNALRPLGLDEHLRRPIIVYNGVPSKQPTASSGVNKQYHELKKANESIRKGKENRGAPVSADGENISKPDKKTGDDSMGECGCDSVVKSLETLHDKTAVQSVNHNESVESSQPTEDDIALSTKRVNTSGLSAEHKLLSQGNVKELKATTKTGDAEEPLGKTSGALTTELRTEGEEKGTPKPIHERDPREPIDLTNSDDEDDKPKSTGRIDMPIALIAAHNTHPAVEVRTASVDIICERSSWWNDELVSFTFGALAREVFGAHGDSLSAYFASTSTPLLYYNQWRDFKDPRISCTPGSQEWQAEKAKVQHSALQFLRNVSLMNVSNPRWLYFPVNIGDHHWKLVVVDRRPGVNCSISNCKMQHPRVYILCSLNWPARRDQAIGPLTVAFYMSKLQDGVNIMVEYTNLDSCMLKQEDVNEWSRHVDVKGVEVPPQQNGFDCGPLVCIMTQRLVTSRLPNHNDLDKNAPVVFRDMVDEVESFRTRVLSDRLAMWSKPDLLRAFGVSAILPDTRHARRFQFGVLGDIWRYHFQERFGIVRDAVLEVQDRNCASNDDAATHIMRPIGDLLAELSYPDSSACWNALSIPLTTLSGSAGELHRVVSDGTRSMDSFWMSLPQKENSGDKSMAAVAALAPVLVDGFLIVSSEGVYHTSHFDPEGFFTMLHVYKGKKLVVLGVPRCGKVKIIRNTKTHWDLFNDPNLDIYLCVIEAGCTLFIPPGTLHAVFTVCGVDTSPEFAIVQGAFFDRWDAQLLSMWAAIRSVAWNTQWSNTELSELREASTLYFLLHHASLDPPLLVHDNLYATLFMAIYALAMRQPRIGDGSEQCKEERLPLLEILKAKALDIVKNLSNVSADKFHEFAAEYAEAIKGEVSIATSISTQLDA